jgi:hypothetical protein
MRLLSIFLVWGVALNIESYNMYADQTPEQVNQYMQQNQAPVTNPHSQMPAGPTNAVSMPQIRGMFSKQWNICKAVFNHAHKSCKTPDSLDKENAIACVKMYEIAADSCYTAMSAFSFHLV